MVLKTDRTGYGAVQLLWSMMKGHGHCFVHGTVGAIHKLCTVSGTTELCVSTSFSKDFMATGLKSVFWEPE